MTQKPSKLSNAQDLACFGCGASGAQIVGIPLTRTIRTGPTTQQHQRCEIEVPLCDSCIESETRSSWRRTWWTFAAFLVPMVVGGIAGAVTGEFRVFLGLGFVIGFVAMGITHFTVPAWPICKRHPKISSLLDAKEDWWSL